MVHHADRYRVANTFQGHCDFIFWVRQSRNISSTANTKLYTVNGDAVSVEHIVAGINQKKHKFHSSSNVTLLYLPETHPHPDHHTQPSTCFTSQQVHPVLPCAHHYHPTGAPTTMSLHQLTNPIIHTQISPSGTLCGPVDPKTKALESFTTSMTIC